MALGWFRWLFGFWSGTRCQAYLLGLGSSFFGQVFLSFFLRLGSSFFGSGFFELVFYDWIAPFLVQVFVGHPYLRFHPPLSNDEQQRVIDSRLGLFSALEKKKKVSILGQGRRSGDRISYSSFTPECRARPLGRKDGSHACLSVIRGGSARDFS